jgi:hypothetical protein
MILSLHQGLARNDHKQASDTLYAHLLTHHDCVTRFNELVEGVKRGLGLSSFLSPDHSIGEEYGEATKAENGDDSGAEDDAEEEDMPDAASSDVTGSGAERQNGEQMNATPESVPGQDEDDEEEEDEEENAEDAEDGEDDNLGGDNLPNDLDDPENMGAESYETGSLKEETLQEVQLSVGDFVDEAVAIDISAPEDQLGGADDFINFEEVGEFENYDEIPPADGSGTAEIAANGKYVSSPCQSPDPLQFTSSKDDADLIDFWDDDGPVAADGTTSSIALGWPANEVVSQVKSFTETEALDEIDSTADLAEAGFSTVGEVTGYRVSPAKYAWHGLQSLPVEVGSEAPFVRASLTDTGAHSTLMSTPSATSLVGRGSGFNARIGYEQVADHFKDQHSTAHQDSDRELHDFLNDGTTYGDEAIANSIPELGPDATSQPTTATSTLRGDEQLHETTADAEHDEIDWEDQIIDDDNAANTTIVSVQGKRSRVVDELEDGADESGKTFSTHASRLIAQLLTSVAGVKRQRT